MMNPLRQQATEAFLHRAVDAPFAGRHRPAGRAPNQPYPSSPLGFVGLEAF